MSYKGIILDLDDTLYDYKEANKLALEFAFKGIMERSGLSREEVETSFFMARRQIHTELEMTASSHNRLLYFQRMYEVLGINPVLYSLDDYENYWSTLLYHMRTNEFVYEFLESVQDKKICILTDLTAHIQHRKIRKLKLEPYIDYLVTSEEAGSEKPHSNMFLLAIQKMNLSSADVCMIGDSYKKDVLGAQRVNIDAYWFNPSGEHQDMSGGIYSFQSFNDLMNMEMTK